MQIMAQLLKILCGFALTINTRWERYTDSLMLCVTKRNGPAGFMPDSQQSSVEKARFHPPRNRPSTQ
jgi:hypothetical protein